MTTFRFLHLADIHLDTLYRCRDDGVRRRLHEAGEEALERAVRLAVAEQVDAVLIAGDLFDGERLRVRTEHFLLRTLRDLDEAGIAVIYATGNHDPGSHERVRRFDWPRNVTLIADAAPRTVEVRNRSGALVGRVTAAGHATGRVAENLARRFPAAGGNLPAVALLHTQVEGSGGEHERYAPCTVADLQGKGYAYWALGHVHRRQAVPGGPLGPTVWYAGNLVGRHPNETGAKGGLLVTVNGTDVQVDFRPLAPLRWERVVLDRLEAVDTVEKLLGLLAAAVERLRAAEGAGDEQLCLRVELRGGCPLATRLRQEEERTDLEILCGQEVGALLVELRTEALFLPVDVAAEREAGHVLATALSLLEQAAVDDELLDALAPAVLAGWSGELRTAEQRDRRRAYLRTLLERADRELVERFTRE